MMISRGVCFFPPVILWAWAGISPVQQGVCPSPSRKCLMISQWSLQSHFFTFRLSVWLVVILWWLTEFIWGNHTLWYKSQAPGNPELLEPCCVKHTYNSGWKFCDETLRHTSSSVSWPVNRTTGRKTGWEQQEQTSKVKRKAQEYKEQSN